MASVRDNRFRIPSRTFHTPVDGDWHNDTDAKDVELGQLLPNGRSSLSEWDNEDHRASSEQEAEPCLRKKHRERSRSRSKKRQSLPARHIHAIKSESRAGTRSTFCRWRSRACSKVAWWIKVALMTIGLLQGAIYAFHILEDIFPDELDLVSGALWDNMLWSQVPNTAWASRLDQLTADVQPVMCHSHNDYWRREPLYQAIHLGCTGVEADLWFLHDELYVAHTVLGIREERTLENLYLNPIVELLDQKNIVPDILAPEDSDHNECVGVFDTRPKQSLVLLVDFKNEPEETWNRLVSLLAPLHEKHYLTFFNGIDVVNGPLTIVASGMAPFHRIVENSTYRHIFYDAPLGDLDFWPVNSSPPPPSPDLSSSHSGSDQTSSALVAKEEPIYTPFNSYYASVSFKRSIGWPYHSSINQTQLQKIRRDIRAAHAMGLKVRYWRIPEWPIGLRNYLWRVLVREGVDYLSVDDIEDVRWENWGPRKGGWGKKWWR